MDWLTIIANIATILSLIISIISLQIVKSIKNSIKISNDSEINHKNTIIAKEVRDVRQNIK